MTSSRLGYQKPVILRRELPNLHTGDSARNDESLDLAGALENCVDLRVAVPTFNGIVANVAVPAKDLNRLFSDLHRRLTGEEFGHRTLAARERLSRRGHPTRAPDQ